MAISFHNADIMFSLRNRTVLRKFIEKQVLVSRKKVGSLSFVFCSDEYLLNINRQFLNHDYYTDIITFPLNENLQTLEAEIYISIDRVKENSKKFEEKPRKSNNTSSQKPKPGNELHRVIFHGVLHLLGYKDKNKAQQTEMRAMEDAWLKRYQKFADKAIGPERKNIIKSK